MSQEDIYQALGEIRAELRALIQYLHRHIDHHTEEHRVIGEKLERHESYINKQEGARSVLVAAAAMIAAVIGAFVSGIVQWVVRRLNGG